MAASFHFLTNANSHEEKTTTRRRQPPPGAIE
jgi:hypothetical protein